MNSLIFEQPIISTANSIQNICQPLYIEGSSVQSSKFNQPHLQCSISEILPSKNCQQINIQSTFVNLLMKLKIQKRMKYIISFLSTRMFNNLSPKQFDLINDKSVNSQFYRRFEKAIKEKYSTIESTKKKQNQVKPLTHNLEYETYRQTEKHPQLIYLLIKQLEMIPVFNPCNHIRIIWDFLLLVIVILYLFLIPIHLIYEINYNDLIPKGIIVITPIVFMLELSFAFNTGYYEKGIYIDNRQSIINNWIKNILPYDLISNFPLIMDIFITVFSSNEEHNSLGLDVVSILFVLNIDKLLSRFNKFQEMYIIKKKHHNIIYLIKLMIFMMFLSHIFSCCFLQVGIYNEQHEIDNWLRQKQLVKSLWLEQYINSYYFAIVTMGTVGYGDVAPVAQNEKLLVVFLILISCGVFGYLLNCINQIFDEFIKENKEKQAHILSLNRYMNKKGISNTLQQQVREYLQYVMKESKDDNDNEQKAINQLSESLKEKLYVEANKIVLIDSPVFKENFSSQIINKTVTLIKEFKCAPEQNIYLRGENCNNIFFIEQGSVELFLPYQKTKGNDESHQKVQTLQVLKQGEQFGTFSFFTGMPQIFNIHSLEFTVLLYIRRDDFLNLVQQYTEDYERFCFLKDNISLYNNYNKLNLYCYSCQSTDHLLNSCPYVHHLHKSHNIIKKFTYSKQQDRLNKFIRLNKKFHTLKLCLNINKRLSDFQTRNELDLDQYEMINDLDVYEGLNSEIEEDTENDIENSGKEDKEDSIEEDQDNEEELTEKSNCDSISESNKSNSGVEKDLEKLKSDKKSTSQSQLYLTPAINVITADNQDKLEIIKQKAIRKQQKFKQLQKLVIEESDGESDSSNSSSQKQQNSLEQGNQSNNQLFCIDFPQSSNNVGIFDLPDKNQQEQILDIPFFEVSNSSFDNEDINIKSETTHFFPNQKPTVIQHLFQQQDTSLTKNPNQKLRQSASMQIRASLSLHTAQMQQESDQQVNKKQKRKSNTLILQKRQLEAKKQKETELKSLIKHSDTKNSLGTPQKPKISFDFCQRRKSQLFPNLFNQVREVRTSFKSRPTLSSLFQIQQAAALSDQKKLSLSNQQMSMQKASLNNDTSIANIQQYMMFKKKESLITDLTPYLKEIFTHFDQMKSFVSYFPQNNIENVLKLLYQRTKIKSLNLKNTSGNINRKQNNLLLKKIKSNKFNSLKNILLLEKRHSNQNQSQLNKRQIKSEQQINDDNKLYNQINEQLADIAPQRFSIEVEKK